MNRTNINSSPLFGRVSCEENPFVYTEQDGVNEKMRNEKLEREDIMVHRRKFIMKKICVEED